jgi:hypothetical protein
MTWERRCRGGLYYTRTLRRDGKRQRLYYGTGAAAEAAAAEDAARRAAREAQREARRRENARWLALEAPLRELCLLTDLVAHTALVLAGYRFHRHSEWRRRRHAKTT